MEVTPNSELKHRVQNRVTQSAGLVQKEQSEGESCGENEQDSQINTPKEQPLRVEALRTCGLLHLQQ